MLCIKNGLIHDAVSATPYVGDILVDSSCKQLQRR